MALQLESCSIEEMCVLEGGSVPLLVELRGQLRDWLRQQQHLPREIADERLNQIILYNKYSLEKSKEMLDMYYTVRNILPEIFHDRDPLAESVKRIWNSIEWICLPKLSPEKYRVTIFKIVDSEAEKFNVYDCLKIIYMVGDIRFSECRCTGNVFVFDLSSLRLQHLTKLTPSLLKKVEISTAKAYAMKIKGIHLFNTPCFIDHILRLVKSVVRPKLVERLHVHNSIESLYNHISKSILPVDYGGEEQSIAKLKEKWYGKLLKWRDWFLNEGSTTVDESLRLEKIVNYNELFGTHGSFRKLEVD